MASSQLTSESHQTIQCSDSSPVMSFRTASLNLRLAARQPAAASRQQLALRQLHSTRSVAAPSLRPEFQPHVGKFTIEATLK